MLFAPLTAREHDNRESLPIPGLLWKVFSCTIFGPRPISWAHRRRLIEMRTLSALFVCIAILCMAGHGYAQTELVSDDFTGATGTYLGSNWTGCGYNSGAYTKLVYESGAAGGSGYWGQDCALYTGYGAFPSDQYVSVTVVGANPTNSLQASVQMRANATPYTNEAYIACGWDSQDFPANPHYRIWSLAPGSSGPVSLWLSNITPATNDILSCEVLGNTVSMNLNGQFVQSVTDTSGINSGYPGMYYVDPNGTGPSGSDIIFANFQAGNGPSIVSSTITPLTASVPAGSFVQYNGIFNYADGTIATTNNWSSSSTSVATVDITGTAYGIAPGTATLTGSSGPDNVTGTINVESPNGYTPMVYDTFVGTGGGYLGSNWTGCGFSGGRYSKLVYQSNQAGGSGYWTQDCALYTGVGLFPDNQYATAMVVAPTPSSTTEASIELRGNITSGTPERYIACGWDAQDFPADQHYRIWSLAPNGTPTSLFLSTITPKTNDVIWCQVLGTEVTMIVNGTMVAVVKDTSGLTSGYPGLYYIDPNGGVPSTTDVIFDNFGAGQIDNAVPASITLSPSSSTIIGTSTLQYTATGTFTDGTVSNITDTLSWSSSNTSIATVNSSGLATGVGPGTVTITATNGTVSGTASLKVTFLTPTVTFTGAPASAAYNSTFTVTATTNASTMPQITGTAGVCTVGAVTGTPARASALVTMTSGTGTCLLTATWAADSKYLAPTPLTQSTIALKASATLTLSTTNGSGPYGTTPVVSSDYTLTGFVSTDTQASICTGAPSITTTATSTSNVSPPYYTISGAIGTLVCSDPNVNYTFRFINNGRYTVTKYSGTLTLTTTNGTGAYGTTPNVANDYSLTGFVGNQTQSSVCTGSPTVTTTATNTSAPGTYPITAVIHTLACGNANASYTITIVNAGIYTVTKLSANLTLTTTNGSGAYGTTPNVANDYTLTGFEGSDNQTNSCTGAPSITTTATNTSPVSPPTYLISGAIGTLACSGTDYTYTVSTFTNNGVYQVTKATPTLTLTTTNGSGPYGTTPNVANDYTLTGFVGTDTQASACTGSPAVTTSATNTSPVGTYPISALINTLACSSSNATYTVSFANTGLYTVTVASPTLTLTTTSISVPYGSAIPNIQSAYTLTGFKGSDTQATVCTGSPVLSTTATSTSTVGAYPITAVIGTLSCSSSNATYSITIANSGNVNITQATPTISWVPASIVYGQGLTSAQLNAQASAGPTNVSTEGTLTYTYNSNPITLGTVLPFGNDQICVVFAPSAGYTADLTASAQFCVTESVTAAPLTITATPYATAVYGTPLPNATYTYTLTGFVGTDTQASVCTGAPTLSTPVDGQTNPYPSVGIYTVNVSTAGFACTGYAFAINTGELHITPATLVIQPVAVTAAYDSQVPSYSYTCSFQGNLLGTNSCGTGSYAVTGTPTINTTATIRASSTPGVVYYTSNVGTYALNASWGSLKSVSGNFTFSTSPSTLTLTTSPQSITVQPYSITIKQATCLSSGLPALTYKITGLLNWDTQASTTTGAAALSIDPSYTGNCAKGTYTIHSAAGSLQLDEYNGETDYTGIIYGTNTLTID